MLLPITPFLLFQGNTEGPDEIIEKTTLSMVYVF